MKNFEVTVKLGVTIYGGIHRDNESTLHFFPPQHIEEADLQDICYEISKAIRKYIDSKRQ